MARWVGTPLQTIHLEMALPLTAAGWGEKRNPFRYMRFGVASVASRDRLALHQSNAAMTPPTQH
jgi:hypothetical protein